MLTVTRSREYLTDSFVGTHEGCGIFIPANRMLYQFVSDNPSNTDRDQIASKALIIGRSLAASAERRTIKGERLSSADFFHGLADAISKSGLEEVLDFLPQDGTISRSTSTEVHKAHAFLCSAITGYTQRDCSSFASKYLHFHRPNHFPMMDSRARTALKWVAEEEGWVFAFTTSRSAKNYPEYVRIYLNAKDVFEADLGRPLSLRQMDNILLNRYDNYI
ncbi:hypothetical protein EON09_22275 [Pseudomonas soli]|uniref:Uncharacterized protein n=1 Tax=Pseudomonas soli TaxID=1306993 RepID=A0A1H8ZLB3_9PSED|nr:hypothetical protein [Pseudomonas soli]MDT3716788.1 hypothetical protein [Pseudomonas soli]MDT3733461.1 hypothetical protein [Pseudomonas soli]MEE1880832.1 hypothetical protein [Pseudomonas soli]NBK41252.1 hypothetical protein [Pseudomonas soli]WJO19605.1 hypothetical protein LU688_15020 [Pseudomonas soli]